MGEISHWYLHVDLDAFFASVEALDNPQYRGKPLIVGGKPTDRRSVVSTASYEARKYGVHSAMPTFQAYKLCPQGIYVYPRMERYAELSYQIMNIFRNYSPDVDQMSIDEAFIDLTGTEKLFGPPEETAKKIKADVKNQTGLTVSVGLAPTKYLAKIASGFSKPDGFYYIHKGDEEKFMLSLPLNKVWGLGPKSLDLLRSKGIKTTRDIFDQPYENLEFLFGKNMASFLYAVVRGQEKESFTRKTKSHSLSNETTFPYDLTDVYMIETELLELCHSVFFRLLKENSFSRTAFIKIRYDDFSTCTVQETLDRNIITLDSFFEVIKGLFEKKYQEGRGIRLLGVGFENIEKEEKPYQQTLFDNGDEKKQAVEKAILKLQKKHPEIKINKARTLKAVIFFLLLTFFPGNKANAEEQIDQQGAASASPSTFYEPEQTEDFAPPGDFDTDQGNDTRQVQSADQENADTSQGQSATSQENALPQGDSATASSSEESSSSLFDWNINEKNKVEFLLSGYWQTALSETILATFGNGTNFTSSWGSPIFKQEVELSAWVFLNKTWYFQADFADEFKKNTLALGYQGQGFLKSARLANRGISLENSYSAESFGFGLKGGKNQAPGFSSYLQSPDEKLEMDFLLRYDMTTTKSASFYGMNSVQDLKISPENFLYGYSYRFPENTEDFLGQIKEIYVESAQGSYSDENGRKYKKLSANDYTYQTSTNRLYLSVTANAGKQDSKIPTVLVTFSTPATTEKIINATGSYSDSSSFAGKIQAEFSATDRETNETSTAKTYNLADFTAPLSRKINEDSALVIQSSSGFSPYLCPDTYDGGLSTEADILVVKNSTDISLKQYIGEECDLSFASLYEDFFNEKHIYATITNAENPDSLYPFASLAPEIYLNLANNSDIAILFRTYSQVSEYQIGTNAAAGSVLVYKNNVIDPTAKYDSSTGVVTLGSSPSSTDKIYIIWQEDSEDFSGGALTGGGGLKYHFTENLTGDAFFSARWPLAISQNYSTVDNLQRGFFALTTGIEYSSQNFNFSNKTAISLQKDNAASALLVSSQADSSPETYYLDSSSGYITKANPVLNLDDDQIELSQTANATITNHTGLSDSQITGYKIPLQWDFSSLNQKANLSQNSDYQFWAAVDIKLGAGNLLKNSSQLNFALKYDGKTNGSGDGTSDKENYQIYLQLGVNASSDFYGEDSQNIPTWKIENFDFSKSDWQTLSIYLDDKDRARLVSAYDARLIITGKKITGTDDKGCIYFGPYEPITKSLNVFYDDNYTVTTTSIYNGDENYSAILNWNISSTSQIENIQDTKITGLSYFDAADFSSYQTINLKFAINAKALETSPDQTESLTTRLATIQADDNYAFTLILDDAASDYQEDGNIALKIQIKNISDFYDDNLTYHTLGINLKEKTASIDQNPLENQNYTIYINPEILPTRQKIVINTLQGENFYKSGTFYLNDLTFSDSQFYANLQNQIQASYKKDGDILTFGNYSLVKDFSVEAQSTQSTGKLSKNLSDFDFSVNSNAKTGITLAGISLQADAALQNADFTNAGHSFKSQNKIFGVLSLEENYRFSHSDSSLNKEDKVEISLEKIKIPLKLSLSANGQEEFAVRNQNFQGKSALNLDFGKNYGLNWDFSLNAKQKIKTAKNSDRVFDTDNYFKGWQDISSLEFSLGQENASLRNTNFSTKVQGIFPQFNFKPAIEYNLTASYSNSKESIFKDSGDLTLSLPFTFKANNLSFTLGRKAGGSQNVNTGGTYISDSQALFDLQKNRTELYTSIPFYELFDKNLAKQICDDYAAKYEFSYKRRLFNNMKDLYIPSVASFALVRQFNNDAKYSDLYQIKTVITNNSLNNFGSNSLGKYFFWFKQEEIISNITGIIKIPTDLPENTTYQLTAYLQILFFIANKARLTTAFDASFETDLTWATHASLIYSRPGKSSLITEFAKIIIPPAKNQTFEITRKDSLNIEISKSDSSANQKYNYQHSVDFGFLQYFTVTTGLGASFTYTENSTSSLGFTATIGGKAEF